MLTVRFDVIDLKPGHRLLDLGCGAGRHSFGSLKRGAYTVSMDLDDAVLKDVKGMTSAMRAAGEVPDSAGGGCLVGDALRLPFADRSFERVIAAEVLEHIGSDARAMGEIARVLKPNGKAVVTVPRFWTEAINWGVSRAYRESPGGHVRIYRRAQLFDRLRRAGLEPFAVHHAHAFHSPYWWLRSLVGIDRERLLPVRAYHSFLAWDIERAHPSVRAAERMLDPILGKSIAVYVTKSPDV